MHLPRPEMCIKSRLTMSITFYFLMVLFGYLGMKREILDGKKSSSCLIGLLVLFICAICSRVGHGYDYSDITYYVDYFLNDNNVYFEPGYVFFIDTIKFLWGYRPLFYIASVGLWIIVFVLLSNRIGFMLSPRTLLTGEIQENNNTLYSYSCTFFFLFSLYWGCSFGCEVIRLGMAISILFCSMAFAVNEKYLYAIPFVVIAFFFQYTSLVFMSALIVLYYLKPLTKKVYIYWVICLIFGDFLFAVGLAPSLLGSSFLNQVLSFSDVFSHYEAYDNYKEGDISWLSLQYIAYYVFAFYMLAGNLDSERYNRSIMIYYIGLTFGVLLRGTDYAMRIQWIFFPSIVFALYYYITEGCSIAKKKLYIASLYSIIQMAMAIRYLGALHI